MIVQSHGLESLTVAGHTLDARQARFTLDEQWAPYGQGEIVCPLPDAATVDDIDPRDGVRVQFTLTRDVGAQARDVGAQARDVDVLLVERTVDHLAATLTMVVATDEQLLIDYGLLGTAVNTSAEAHQSSLRAILNNVVLPTIGATLQPGSADYDCTIDSDSVNLIPNPSFEVNTSGWEASRASIARTTSRAKFGTASLEVTVTDASNPSYPMLTSSGAVPVVPLTTYTFSVWVYSTVATTINIYPYQYNASGTFIASAFSPWTAVPANVWTRVSHTFTAQPGAATLRPSVNRPAAAVGTKYWLDGAQLNEGTLVPYFDGTTADSDLFEYAWTGAAHASASTRTGRQGRSEQMLQWEPGEKAWDFVAPLVEAAGLRLFCDEQRRWWLQSPDELASGMVTITEGVNLTEGSDTISRSRDWFDGVVVKYAWNHQGASMRAWDSAGSTPTSVVALDRQRPFPGPGAAAAILNRSSGRGRTQEVAALSDYTATPGMAVQITLPGTPIQTGQVSAVVWRFPDDQMQIKSRGLTDTPPTAWSFLAAGQTWLASPVGESWEEEVA